jgi:restriction system protein
MGKKKSDPAFPITELVSYLPWWVAAGIGVTSYPVLNRFSRPRTLDPTQPTKMLETTLVPLLCGYAKFLVPFFCAIAALWSLVRRRDRPKELALVQSAHAINSLSWKDFETQVAEAYRRKGYTAVETGGGGPDGGVDIELRKGSEFFLVQCKQWRSTTVGVGVVRELLGSMVAVGATGGMVVTSGTFSKEAEAFVKGRNIELINGPSLLAVFGANRLASVGPRLVATGPVCPKCSVHFVSRIAKRGKSSGSEFWGCPNYPRCRQTRNK